MSKFTTTTTIGFSINYGIDGAVTVKDENASSKQENMFKALSYGNINALQQLVCLYTTLDLSEEERVKLLTLYTENLNDLDAQEGIFSYYLNKDGLEDNNEVMEAASKGSKQPKYELPYGSKNGSISTASTKGSKQPKYELPYSMKKKGKGTSDTHSKGSKHPKYELPYDAKKPKSASSKSNAIGDDILSEDNFFKGSLYDESILKNFFKGARPVISFVGEDNDDNDIEEEDERLGLIFPKIAGKKEFSEYASIAKANVPQATNYDDNHITVYNSTLDEMEKAVLILSYLGRDYGFDLAIELLGKYYPIVWFKFKKHDFDIEKLVEDFCLGYYEPYDEKDKNLLTIINNLKEKEGNGED